MLRDPGPPCAEAPFSRGFHLDACRAAPGEARRGEARGGFSGPASRPEGPPLAAGCRRPPSGDGFPGGPSRRSPGRVGVRVGVGVRARRAEPGPAMLPPCLRPRRLLPAPPSRPAATGAGPARGPGAGRGAGSAGGLRGAAVTAGSQAGWGRCGARQLGASSPLFASWPRWPEVRWEGGGEPQGCPRGAESPSDQNGLEEGVPFPPHPWRAHSGPWAVCFSSPS